MSTLLERLRQKIDIDVRSNLLDRLCIIDYTKSNGERVCIVALTRLSRHRVTKYYDGNEKYKFEEIPTVFSLRQTL